MTINKVLGSAWHHLLRSYIFHVQENFCFLQRARDKEESGKWLGETIHGYGLTKGAAGDCILKLLKLHCFPKCCGLCIKKIWKQIFYLSEKGSKTQASWRWNSLSNLKTSVQMEGWTKTVNRCVFDCLPFSNWLIYYLISTLLHYFSKWGLHWWGQDPVLEGILW